MKQALFLYACCLVFVFCLAPFCHAETISEQLQAAVRKDLKAAMPGDVELQDVRFLQGVDAAQIADFRIVNVVQSGYAAKNRINYLVSVKDRNGQLFSLPAEAVYDVFVDILVTSRSLQKGAIIAPDDYYRVRQRMSRLPVGALVRSDDADGKSVRINLAEGVVLKQSHLLASDYVRRGQKVRIEIESGSVVVTAPGVLRNGGAVGSVVRVFCETSKRELQGMLVASDLVRVKS